MANYFDLSFPQLKPEKCIGDYLQSKVETKRAFAHRMQQDDSRPDPSLNLVQQNRQLAKAESKLQEQRKAAIDQNTKLESQWDKIGTDTKNFRKIICGFDEMIKENYEKRERLKEKLMKQLAVNAKQDKANESLEQKLQEFLKAKDEMEVQVQKHVMYEEFLQKVVEAHRDFKNWFDVLNKFESLNFARILLVKNIQNNISELENFKTQLLQENMANNVKLTGLQNQIAQLYNRYKLAEEKSQLWETQVRRIQTVLKDKLIDIHKANITCNNIYTHMCTRKKQKVEYPPGDFKNQLGYIKSQLLKLNRTVELAKQKRTEKCSSSQVELPLSMKQKAQKRHK